MTGLNVDRKAVADFFIHLLTHHPDMFVVWVMEMYAEQLSGMSKLEKLDVAGDTLQRMSNELNNLRTPNA